MSPTNQEPLDDLLIIDDILPNLRLLSNMLRENG